MDKRVYSKEESLYDRIPRSKRLSFSTQITEITEESQQVSTEQMENRALNAVIELVDKQGVFSLEQVFEHRVTDECLSVYNANGTLRKVQKSSLLKAFEYHEVDRKSCVILIIPCNA